MPVVTEDWQVYALIFLVQAASAGVTPAVQATIPDVLPDDKVCTNIFSLLRLTEDLEQLLRPVPAAALLTVVSLPELFGGTVLGFIGSALLVATAALPASAPTGPDHFRASATKGVRIPLPRRACGGQCWPRVLCPASPTGWMTARSCWRVPGHGRRSGADAPDAGTTGADDPLG